MVGEYERVMPREFLSIENTEEIPSLVENGLVAVTLCREGLMRSLAAACILSKTGYPTVCIEGGLEVISSLSEKEIEGLTAIIAGVPYVFATIDPDEKREFQKTIDRLNKARKNQGKLEIFVQSDIAAIPAMLKQHHVPTKHLA